MFFDYKKLYRYPKGSIAATNALVNSAAVYYTIYAFHGSSRGILTDDMSGPETVSIDSVPLLPS
jgi:hypothetical protein